MTSPAFKRLVLRLPASAADYPAVTFTAQLAERLGLDVVGLFVEDESLLGLADLPFVRELRALGGGWHPLDAAQLARGAGHASAEAHRLFQQAVKALRVAARFDLAKGPLAAALGAQSAAEDILAVIEPRHPGERVTHQFRELMETALDARCAVLLVPSHIVRRRGPIVALATSGADPSLPAALRIAAAIHERLVVLAPPEIDAAALAQLAAAAHVPVDRVPVGADAAALLAQLARLNERLVVLSRAAADRRLPPQLASGRGIPVLVTQAPTGDDA